MEVQSSRLWWRGTESPHRNIAIPSCRKWNIWMRRGWMRCQVNGCASSAEKKGSILWRVVQKPHVGELFRPLIWTSYPSRRLHVHFNRIHNMYLGFFRVITQCLLEINVRSKQTVAMRNFLWMHGWEEAFQKAKYQTIDSSEHDIRISWISWIMIWWYG